MKRASSTVGINNVTDSIHTLPSSLPSKKWVSLTNLLIPNLQKKKEKKRFNYNKNYWK